MKKLICCLLLISFPLFHLFANPISLDGKEQNKLLQPSSFFFDESGDLTLEEIINLQSTGQFEKYRATSSFHFQENQYNWAWLELDNITDTDQNWVLNFLDWAYIDLYLIKEEGTPELKRTGYKVPFDERDYPQANRSQILISVHSDEVKSCLIKFGYFAENERQPSNLGFTIATQSYADRQDSLLRGGAYGFVSVLIIMFAFNFFVFLVSKDKSYFYYLICLIVGILILIEDFGYGIEIFSFIPGHIVLFAVIEKLLYGFAIISMMGFLISFLNTREQFPKLYKFTMGVILTTCLLDLLLFINFEIIFPIISIFNLLLAIIAFIMFVKSIQAGFYSAIYTLIGFSLSWVFMIISILAANEAIAATPFSRFYAIPFGAVVQILMFSFAISNKINVLRKENVNKQSLILDQMVQNEKLQLKVNKELEQKVSERTAEIINQRKTLEETRFELEKERSDRVIRKALMEKHKAEESEKIRKSFFSKITHEFRTPLTLIMDPLEGIQRNSKESKTQKLAQLALRNSKVMLRLINQLLSLSRMEASFTKPQWAHLDLVAFTKVQLDAFQILFRQKELSLAFTSHSESLRMDFDPDMMEKVLNNIFSNAIKFTQKGGKVSVQIEKYQKGNKYVSITIKDTGIGISEEKLPFIFNQFYQIDGNKTTELEGTGLGLPISQELVKLHKGEIKVSSIPGVGSSFSIILPRVNTEVNHEDSADKPASRHQNLELEALQIMNVSSQEWDLDEDLENLILVIEDNRDVRDYIRMILEPDFVVIEAVDGEVGIQLALSQIPDLIISDIMMPKVDGYEVCKQVKANDKTRHIPLIMLTAKSTFQDKLDGYETGADAYLSKPFSSKELKIRIANLMQNREWIRNQSRKEMLTVPVLTESTSEEERFLIRLRNEMMENLSDENFSVESLATAMAMSRSQLHRKLKAILNQSVSEFMRKFRLGIAYQMLDKNVGTVGEIAYKVGFSNNTYFSKAFSAEFKMTPRDVRKKGKAKSNHT